MAARIPIHVHVGVTLQQAPAGQVCAETRITITSPSGPEQGFSIPAGDVPMPDEAGNLHFVAGFTGVQSGEDLHVEVEALDSVGAVLGVALTHDTHLEAVPDDPAQMYYAPQSIYMTVP